MLMVIHGWHVTFDDGGFLRVSDEDLEAVIRSLVRSGYKKITADAEFYDNKPTNIVEGLFRVKS